MLMNKPQAPESDTDDDMESPGEILLKLAQALSIVLASLCFVTLFIISLIGHWDWVLAYGIWFILASAILLIASFVSPRFLSMYNDHQDRKVDRDLKQEQINHLKVKTKVLERTVPMDERGNAAVLLDKPEDKERLAQLSGNCQEHPLLTNYHDSRRITSVQEEKQQQEPLALPKPVPTGRQLLESGAVERALRQGKIILGPKEDGELGTLPIKRCFSSLISGIPSTGKSTTVFWIAGQLVIVEAKIWVVDPHLHYQSEDGERSLGAELNALSESFVFPVCDDDQQQVTTRVKYMFNELLRRERPGYIARASDTIIGIFDEFNTVAAGFDPRQPFSKYKGQHLNFSQTISLIEREGRKFGLHFMLIGHRWADRDIGGDSAVRTNATTYLCHRMNDQGQADLLLGKGYGKKILQLGVGEYWITGSSWREEAQTKIVTPMISAVDLPLILAIKQKGVVVANQANVIEGAVSKPMSTPVSTPMSTPPVGYSEGHTSGHNTDPLVKPVDTTTVDVSIPADLQQKMHMVLDLDAKPGTTQNEIIREVWGVNPQDRQGRAAAEELRKIRSHIAAQLKRGR